MTLRFGVFLAITALLSACTVDIGGGSQLAGQRCFQESDCSEGLTCVERVCTPMLGAVRPGDAGDNASTNGATNGDTNANNNNGNNNNNNGNNVLPDAGVDFGADADQNCEVGSRRCVADNAYEVCVEVADGITRFREVPCDEGQFCEDGDCEGGQMCRDVDDDGYGDGCRRGPDCDDGNPNVNPGAEEDCNTPFDDDCDQRANEGCSDCCPMGCAQDEFCSTECICEPYDIDVCEFQNQPCNQEGVFQNGFGCFSFGGTAEPKCWGICQLNADDPDSTCPGDDSVCAFDAGDGENGICLSTCDQGPNGNTCGPPDLGCLNLATDDADGICAPINPDNDRNETCNAQTFFDCDEGLVCLSFQGGNQGRCREACRPFANPGNQTDCDMGHCLPFSSDFGVCFQDNMSMEGETCNPPQSACGEDTVGCYPTGQGQTECQRLCRLDEGDDDCQGNDSCAQFDPQQEELGVCF